VQGLRHYAAFAPGIESIDQAVVSAKSRGRFGGIRPSAARGGPHVAFGSQLGAFSQRYVLPSPELEAPGSSSGSGTSAPLLGPAGPYRSAEPPYLPPPQLGTLSADERHYIEFDCAEELTTAIGERLSVVGKSPLALSYHVEGASGVPSDNVPHQVSIAVLHFK